jgi:hypothetical protein
VHFYYNKLNSRKASHKFEGLVFASSQEKAEQLIEELISKFPIKNERLTISSSKKTLEEIYNDRPELRGINPDEGCICDELSHIYNLRKYVV